MIDRIFHIADIHIRNYKRHSEYRKVFDWTLEYIENNRTDNSVIYLAGDIVHSKTDLSPEVVEMTALFLNRCSSLCPTILITGNHDTNLNNNNRMDALTPIVNAIDNPNLHYLRETGVYNIDGITWVVFSVFGPPSLWPKASDVNGDFKIALHHGAVTSAVTDLNYVVENETVTPKVFQGYDLALLGDIHKHQYLNNQKTVCYPGSLIQQNHGEGLQHGFVVWDLPEKKPTYIKAPNDIAYYTVIVDDGKITNSKEEFEQLPGKLRLRIKHSNTSQSQLMNVISILKKKYILLEYVLEKVDGGEDIRGASAILGNVRDIEYQNKLITQYLETRPDVDKIDLDGVRHLNRTLNSNLFKKDKLIRNVIWKPLDFEFSNMFSYGESNRIDFTNKTGTQGIFAPNASGKSTLLDSIVFCLFDKSSRTYKGTEIINNRKDSFKCKFRFEMAGDIYVIERKGTKDKHENVRVDVEFYKINLSGDKVSLNGADRYKTDKVIRDYIGSYDDFMLTTFSSQNDNKNFIFKNQRERQELLNSFLDNTIFEKLSREAKETLKEHKTNIKYLEKEMSEMDIHSYRSNLKDVKKKLNKVKKEKKSYEEDVNEYRSKRRGIINSKKKLPEVMSIEVIEQSIVKTQDKIRELKEQFKEVSEDIMHHTAEQVGYGDLASKLDEDKYEEYRTHIKKLEPKISEQYISKTKLESELEHMLSLTSQLDNHEYDPNCEYCVNNSFVKSANQALKEIPRVEKQIQEIEDNIVKMEGELSEAKGKFKFQKTCYEADEEIDKIQNTLESLEESKESIQNLISSAEVDIANYEKQKEKYNQYKEEVIQNEKLDDLVGEINEKLEHLSKDISVIGDEIITFQVELTNLNNKINDYKECVSKLKFEETQYKLYEAYVDAVSRNGVPYMLLSKVLPVIQMEVNEILSRIVDFSVEFFTDDNKNIHCKINYSDERHWPVELASGMEKFMISIATRAALVDITSLPRPNFIAIDEGFGVLDSENLASVNLLFENLKSEFEFILCISHLEDMKDLADNLIFINKDDKGYSSVNA